MDRRGGETRFLMYDYEVCRFMRIIYVVSNPLHNLHSERWALLPIR